MWTEPLQENVSPASVVPLKAYGLFASARVRKSSRRMVTGPNVV